MIKEGGLIHRPLLFCAVDAQGQLCSWHRTVPAYSRSGRGCIYHPAFLPRSTVYSYSCYLSVYHLGSYIPAPPLFFGSLRLFFIPPIWQSTCICVLRKEEGKMKSAFYKIQVLLISITLLVACSKQSQGLTDNIKRTSDAVSFDPKSISPGPMPPDSSQIDSLNRKGFN
jgi:hypothetical protein